MASGILCRRAFLVTCLFLFSLPRCLLAAPAALPEIEPGAYDAAAPRSSELFEGIHLLNCVADTIGPKYMSLVVDYIDDVDCSDPAFVPSEAHVCVKNYTRSWFEDDWY
ncbi:hypothetical protein B0T24DRAFT_700553 [Lasiosphaeria ovina]|uniref:Pheromone n=1 Tax=Lasiosphaeria ovina TaxID=92902 RepID=A0AAE0NAE5_9PEZI|nr:hypothetical protein B0T24DRAFT_700553 [Lasiosphaeria ovina]